MLSGFSQSSRTAEWRYAPIGFLCVLKVSGARAQDRATLSGKRGQVYCKVAALSPLFFVSFGSDSTHAVQCTSQLDVIGPHGKMSISHLP